MEKLFDKLILIFDNESSIKSTNLSKFSFLCLVLLSHRTKDITINNISDKFNCIKSSKELTEINPNYLFEMIKSVNFSSKKTRILINVANYIEENFSGITPITFEELISIPFVGPKTASVMSTHFNKNNSVIAIDTHINRFFIRFFDIKKCSYLKKSDLLKQNVSNKFFPLLSNSLIGFAKKICVKKPKCNICPIKDKCKYNDKTV